ncbi:MAG: tetratricopeptide repeat protein [Candidatus Wallbacteria bacterium]|nr:tetratricopeptide repeat protein [Candidatus Wallbacteria bacterium]
MPAKNARILLAILALGLPGQRLAFGHEESMETPRRFDRALEHHQMHGLLGPSATMEDMIQSGRALFEQCRFEAAAVMFQVAARYFPDSAAPWFALGQARFATGDYAQASEALREGLSIDPFWAKIDYSVYGLYGWPHDLDRQVGLLKDYLRDRADDREALFVLGFFEYHVTRNDQARATFLRLSGMRPKDDTVDYYMRLLGEKEKMRLKRPPYDGKPARPKHRRRPRNKPAAAGSPTAPAAPAAASSEEPPAPAAEAPAPAGEPAPPEAAPGPTAVSPAPAAPAGEPPPPAAAKEAPPAEAPLPEAPPPEAAEPSAAAKAPDAMPEVPAAPPMPEAPAPPAAK